MSRISLKERISEGLLLLDGATGTQLIARGIEVGTCNDYLNIESPDVIGEIHVAYFEAGSDAVLTNTFGANRYALKRHGFGEMVGEINTTAAQIARQAAGQDRYVLGDIGPSGDFLEPLGNLKPEGLRRAFTEQAKALLAGGVDGFIIETMTDLDEVVIAIEAVKSVCGELPVFASMAFDSAGGDLRTVMGVDVESAAAKIVPLRVEAAGFNCGAMSLDEYVRLAEKYVSGVRALSDDVKICAEPNAGMPQLVEGNAVYKLSAEDFAAAMERIHSAGVEIIGGCCGTGPAHIEAVAKRLRKC